MLYGACYYPEHREPERWEEDLRLMRDAGINALRIGEFAWKRFEPSEGSYRFDWLDRFVQLAGNYAIGLVLCPPMRTAPVWLVEKDPSMRLETNDGTVLEYASRYTFCINHPLLRDKALQLTAHLAERYAGDSRIIGWHLDNEIGDEPDCHCQTCKTSWSRWLEKKYGGINELNSAWGTVFWGMEYDRFDQIPTPRVTKADYNPGFIQAWRQFRSDCNIEVVRLLAGAIRSRMQGGGVYQYITTNNQMLWNNRTDYYEMAKYLDVAGTNYYPPYGDNCRALSFGLAVNRSCKNAPFHVYELRNEGHSILGAERNTPPPGELERLTMHTVANGADGVFYFPWKRFPFGCEQNHGAITDYDGKPTRMYDECRSIGEKLRILAPRLAGTHVASDIAVLHDYPSRWDVEQPSGWTGDTSVYVSQINKLYHAVRNLGYNCDAVGRNGDFSAYKLLLVPMLSIAGDELVHKLQQYAENGGIIVFHPMCGIKNEEASYYPDRLHPHISSLLGLRSPEVATSGATQEVRFQWRERTYKCGIMHELVQPTTASVEGRFIDRWFAGSPAVTRHPFGNGQAWLIAAFAEADFYRDLISALCEEIGIVPLLGHTPPREIEVTMRRGPDGAETIFVLNTSDHEVKLTLQRAMTDIWNDAHIAVGETALKPYGVMVLAEA